VLLFCANDSQLVGRDYVIDNAQKEFNEVFKAPEITTRHRHRESFDAERDEGQIQE
jgi:hypothetical protein